MMKALLLIMFGLIGLNGLSGQELSENQRKAIYNLEDKTLALEGYDPVSYFGKKGPNKGKKQFSHTHRGVTYLFSNPENLNTFKLNPTKYEPEYGGWCAYAMGATGEKVSVDPETYKIIDQKLYLFYNQFFNNTLKSWNKDQENLKSKADENWIGYVN